MSVFECFFLRLGVGFFLCELCFLFMVPVARPLRYGPNLVFTGILKTLQFKNGNEG